MIFKVTFVLLTLIVQMGFAQAPPVPDPNASANPSPPESNPAQVPTPAPAPAAGVEEMLDASGLVINKNIFNYDGNEGRDPFKVYREFVQPTSTTGGTGAGANPAGSNLEKNIRTAVVPDDIVVQGIFYKKSDPIALIVVKGVKGLNKLKVNSQIGRNEGKIIEIRKDRILIEQFKDFDGQKFSEKIELKVREKKN